VLGKNDIDRLIVYFMDHDKLVENWINQQPDYQWIITEAPVSVDSAQANKSIDMVIVEDYEPPLGEIHNTAIDSAQSINPQKIDRMRAVLSHAPEPLYVRIFEAKTGKITFKAIGQCLSYAKLFPTFYQNIRNITVIEIGIVYEEADPFVEKAAKELEISLHKISNK